MGVSGEQFEIQSDEKFACMVLFPGLQTKCSVTKPLFVGNGCWLSEAPAFSLDNWWKRQLGELVSGLIERSRFVLTAKVQSARLETVDAENESLSDRLHFLLWGIAISAGIPAIERGFFLSGGWSTPKEPSVRTFAPLESFYQTPGTAEPSATVEDLRNAVRFGERFEKFHQERKTDEGRYYRLASGLGAFQSALEARRPAARLHQFVRAIESFLPPSVFGGKNFCTYACNLLKADSRNETTLQQMYDLRSAAEHHRPFDTRTLAGVPEEVAMQRTRQAEAFARELYRRFFAGQGDYLAHFNNDVSLRTLWSDTDALMRLWGEPFDIHAVA